MHQTRTAYWGWLVAMPDSASVSFVVWLADPQRRDAVTQATPCRSLDSDL
jgi:hypothetical protein